MGRPALRLRAADQLRMARVRSDAERAGLAHSVDADLTHDFVAKIGDYPNSAQVRILVVDNLGQTPRRDIMRTGLCVAPFAETSTLK